MCVLFSAPERNKSNDVNYTYHQDPNFYYLTGFTEANSVLIIYKEKHTISGKSVNEILFIPARNAGKEQWTGRMASPENASRISGIEIVLPTNEFNDYPLEYNSMKWILRMKFPKGMTDDRKDNEDVYSLVEHFKLNSGFPSGADDDFKLGKILTTLREVKLEEEIVLMKKAISISIAGHLEMMRALEPGFSEYKTQAVGEYIFKSEGSEATGYPSICGGGENSCILHYESNRKPLKSGELILLDMGAEYHGYTADITRTLPVNGKFTGEQQQIYELVFQAQEAAFLVCQPGNKFTDPHQQAKEVLSQGLMKLGIIREPEELNTYFMHGTSHYLGLDAHDAGTYSALKAGNIITIEPGIYIPEGSPCDPRWWKIGIRLEEDVLITEDGHEVLSGALPRKWQDVEKTMLEKSIFNK